MRETTRKNTRFGGFSGEVDDVGLGEKLRSKTIEDRQIRRWHRRGVFANLQSSFPGKN